MRRGTLAQHLVGLGFRPGQAVEAVATTSTNDALEATEAALAPLCLHVDEGDLPETFDPEERREFRRCCFSKASTFMLSEGDSDEMDAMR